MDAPETTDVVSKWLKELDAEEKTHKDYRRRAKEIVDRYRDEKERQDSRFNILWSNTETLHSAVYSNTPKPDVRRRFLDADPVAKNISEMLERALSYGLDMYDFDGTADASVDDWLVAGLGQVRIRYLPYFEKG